MSIGINASQAFSPNKIADLNLDLDASDLGTIVDSAGVVSQWNYKSGNGSVVQSIVANRPSTGMNTLNGRNVIAFDGSNDFLENVSLTTSVNMTLFIVARVNSIASGFQSVLAMVATDDFQIDGEINGQFLAQFRSDNLGSTSAPAHSSSLVGIPSIINYRLSDNDSNIVLRVNGVQSDEDTYNGGLGLVHMFYLGRNRAGNFLLAVDLAQVVIYNRDLTLSETAAVEAYLSAKWGITLA